MALPGEGAAAAGAARAARRMWTLFEPVHAVVYFAPQARAAFERAGLRGFWRGYFAGRAAPLGAAGAAVVTASFFNFAPAFVARAIPGVWELISPAEALRIRLAAASDALHRLLAGLEAEATGTSPPSPPPTSTDARRWCCAAAWTCAGRTYSRCAAGPTSNGTAHGPGWPAAA